MSKLQGKFDFSVHHPLEIFKHVAVWWCTQEH